MSNKIKAIKTLDKEDFRDNKVAYQSLIINKYSYDPNLSKIIERVIKDNKLNYSHELYKILCFVDKWANQLASFRTTCQCRLCPWRNFCL